MIIPICPKCGRPMALYIDCTSGNPIVGWQCSYDKFDTLMGYKVTVEAIEDLRKKLNVSNEKECQ